MMRRRDFHRKRCAYRAYFGVGGGATVGAFGDSDTWRFQTVMMCPRARVRRGGSRFPPGLDDGAPGQLVTNQALADAFGVSAMPVREALQRLTAARVLTVISGRSIGVPPLSYERLSDLRRVRIELESLAAVWGTPNIGNAEIEQLQECVTAMEEAVRSGDNRALHFGIYHPAQSEALLAIIETLWLQISPYFSPPPRVRQLSQGG